ncbi:MAG TPA: L,D-transpeptidase, partial [Solirubrobacteraceae bacterium]
VLHARIESQLARSLVVAVGRRRFTLRPSPPPSVDLGALVARARTARANSHFEVRAALAPGVTSAYLQRLKTAVYRRPVNSHVIFNVHHLRASRARPGRRLQHSAFLADRVATTLASWTRPRFLRAYTTVARPSLTSHRLRAISGVIVTVSRHDHRARIFRHLLFVRNYRIAVGQPSFPTPTGLFHVQIKQVNPSWQVPRSGWAGALAGETIPGGDPRNPIRARWIGFAGSVGFHGTNDLSSLGSSASHGCIRMTPGAVIDLYRRVRIGTPVYVR